MLSSLIIVVADDDKNDDFRRTERALRNAHPTLQSAVTLRQARDQMKSPNVNVMLLDRGIPIDSGKGDCTDDEWCAFIEEAKLHCAVLGYTAYTSIKDQELARKAGAIDYLNKFWCEDHPEEFASRIAEANSFYLRNKLTLEGQAKIDFKLEEVMRGQRMMVETLKDEFMRTMGQNSKTVYKAGKQAGFAQAQRIHAAKKLGKEFSAWAFIIGIVLSFWHGCAVLWGWLPAVKAFLQAARPK